MNVVKTERKKELAHLGFDHIEHTSMYLSFQCRICSAHLAMQTNAKAKKFRINNYKSDG